MDWIGLDGIGPEGCWLVCDAESEMERSVQFLGGGEGGGGEGRRGGGYGGWQYEEGFGMRMEGAGRAGREAVAGRREGCSIRGVYDGVGFEMRF